MYAGVLVDIDMHPSLKFFILIAFSFEIFLAVYMRIDKKLVDTFINHEQESISVIQSFTEQKSQELTKQPPTAIKIEKIKKNLPIQAALVKDNQWDMFPKSVAWLSTSAVPGEGNVILYAHNWPTLWADLYKLQPGDSIEVQQNQTWLSYTVTESRAVQANDINAVLNVKNQLTLYTCEGSFDQKRRVVYAFPNY